MTWIKSLLTTILGDALLYLQVNKLLLKDNIGLNFVRTASWRRCFAWSDPCCFLLSKISCSTKPTVFAKLPVNRQSETSLGKGEKGRKFLTLHMEGFQNLQKHVEGFRNLLKKQLELINK